MRDHRSGKICDASCPVKRGASFEGQLQGYLCIKTSPPAHIHGTWQTDYILTCVNACNTSRMLR